MVLALTLNKRTECERVQIKELEDEVKRESLGFLKGRQMACRDSR